MLLDFIMTNEVHKITNTAVFWTSNMWAVSRNWSAVVVDVEDELMYKCHFGVYFAPVYYLSVLDGAIVSAAKIYLDP